MKKNTYTIPLALVFCLFFLLHLLPCGPVHHQLTGKAPLLQSVPVPGMSSTGKDIFQDLSFSDQGRTHADLFLLIHAWTDPTGCKDRPSLYTEYRSKYNTKVPHMKSIAFPAV